LALALAEYEPPMAPTRCRKAIELIDRRLLEDRTSEKVGTQQLGMILQRLIRGGRLPNPVRTYAESLTGLGHFGTHGEDERVTRSDVIQVLSC
jgi:hypothetical protein